LVAENTSLTTFTFTAVDDYQAIADAVGDDLEKFPSVSRHRHLDEKEQR
jgi:hypothetical protein